MNSKAFEEILSEAKEHTEYLNERLAIHTETESPNFITLTTCKVKDIYYSMRDLLYLLENANINETCNELMLPERKKNCEPF